VIDTHAHLDSCRQPAADLVEQAALAGVARIVTIGREQAVDLAERLAGVFAVVGWHPHEAAEAGDVDALRPLLAHPRVVGLGECGLDYHRDHAPRGVQRDVFRRQIELANELRTPLVIHTREADADTFALLEDARCPVILHCFSSPGMLGEAVARGYRCSFAGNVTYPSAGALREAAERVPAELILAETDAPYLAPVPHRGRPNVPANVMDTLAFLAAVRGVAVDALEAQIEANAAAVFGFS
jgi:TatD DNase family protein